MGLKIVGGRNLLKRESWIFRSRNQKTLKKSSNLLEAISLMNSNGGVVPHYTTTEKDGVVRMKIVVNKDELEQVLYVMMKSGNCDQKNVITNNYMQQPLKMSAEERLNLLKRRHVLRLNNNIAKEISNKNRWFPALHSIPEEPEIFWISKLQ